MGATRRCSIFAAIVGLVLLAAGVSTPSFAVPTQTSNTAESDEANIEYFNEENYNAGWQVNVASSDQTNYHVSLKCPSPISPDFPPPTLEVSLSTSDGAQATDCFSSTPITLTGQSANCTATLDCQFVVRATNKITDAPYSTTSMNLILAVEETVVPQLDPASLPLVLRGTIPTTSGPAVQHVGTLKLCQPSVPCASNLPSPATDTGYDENSQIYFQTALKNVVE